MLLPFLAGMLIALWAENQKRKLKTTIGYLFKRQRAKRSELLWQLFVEELAICSWKLQLATKNFLRLSRGCNMKLETPQMLRFSFNAVATLELNYFCVSVPTLMT